MSEVTKQKAIADELQEERPPVFRTWRGAYLAVLGNLVLLIVLFYILTKALS